MRKFVSTLLLNALTVVIAFYAVEHVENQWLARAVIGMLIMGSSLNTYFGLLSFRASRRLCLATKSEEITQPTTNPIPNFHSMVRAAEPYTAKPHRITQPVRQRSMYRIFLAIKRILPRRK